MNDDSDIEIISQPSAGGEEGGGAAAAADADTNDEVLDCVQITPEHLRGNGTLHTSPFAGMAELFDNAVDSGASAVHIESYVWDNKEEIITVRDNGKGMNREEALQTILIGYSSKRGDATSIGQFGNGLKSGSMRLASSMMLMTIRGGEITILMISLKFLSDRGNMKCYVPCITVKANPLTKKYVRVMSDGDHSGKHDRALAALLEYSPFMTEERLYDFMACSLGSSPSGTVVVLYDLKKLENGQHELVLEEGDLVVKSREEGERHKSLSEYLKQLYANPKIVIYINCRKVRLEKPELSLMERRWTLLAPQGMESFQNRARERLQVDLRLKKEERARARDYKLKIDQMKRNEEAQMVKMSARQLFSEQRRAADNLGALTAMVNKLEQQLSVTKLTGKEAGGEIRVIFGIDLMQRERPRIIFYSNGRRILEQPMDEKAARKFELLGVVAIVDISSHLLPPSTNREKYETPSELSAITLKITKLAKLYFELADSKFKSAAFWSKFGYNESWGALAGAEWTPDLYRQAASEIGAWGQCELCLAFTSFVVGRNQPVPFLSLELPEQHYKCVQLPKSRQPPGPNPKTCTELFPHDKKALDIKELVMNGLKAAYVKEKEKPPAEGPSNRECSLSLSLIAGRKPRADSDDDDDFVVADVSSKQRESRSRKGAMAASLVSSPGRSSTSAKRADLSSLERKRQSSAGSLALYRIPKKGDQIKEEVHPDEDGSLDYLDGSEDEEVEEREGRDRSRGIRSLSPERKRRREMRETSSESSHYRPGKSGESSTRGAAKKQKKNKKTEDKKKQQQQKQPAAAKHERRGAVRATSEEQADDPIGDLSTNEMSSDDEDNKLLIADALGRQSKLKAAEEAAERDELRQLDLEQVIERLLQTKRDAAAQLLQQKKRADELQLRYHTELQQQKDAAALTLQNVKLFAQHFPDAVHKELAGAEDVAATLQKIVGDLKRGEGAR